MFSISSSLVVLSSIKMRIGVFHEYYYKFEEVLEKAIMLQSLGICSCSIPHSALM